MLVKVLRIGLATLWCTVTVAKVAVIRHTDLIVSFHLKLMMQMSDGSSEIRIKTQSCVRVVDNK